eukprot:2225938-Amphidinium_carterae.1
MMSSSGKIKQQKFTATQCGAECLESSPNSPLNLTNNNIFQQRFKTLLEGLKPQGMLTLASEV